MGLGTTKVRVLWPWDTAAKAIPSGFTRDTAWDDLYLQGDDETYTGPADAGNATHDHAAASTHTHTGNTHWHSCTGRSGPYWSAAHPGGMAIAWAAPTHGHSASTSGYTAITYGTASVDVTAAASEPPYVKAILLQPDDIGQDFPEHGVCYGDTTPTGMSITDGDGATDDLDDLYVQGATEPAGVGGDTGGSATHDHGGSTVGHAHSITNHSHAAALCGGATSTVSGGNAIGVQNLALSNHHYVTLIAKGLADCSTDPADVAAASSDPAYIRLLGLQNTSGGSLAPADGMILPFVGAVDDIPRPWVLCDGSGGTQDCRDRQVKITTATGEIGDTGGSDSHTHTIDDHGHTHTGTHNHTYSASVLRTTRNPGGGAALSARGLHIHTWTISQVTPTMQDATCTVDASDGRAPYRTCVYVRYSPGDVTLHIDGSTHLAGSALLAG